MPSGTPGRCICSIEGCTKVVNSKGLCESHRKKQRRKIDSDFLKRERAVHRAWLATANNRDRALAATRKWRKDRVIREKALCYEAYGGYLCVCCEETEPVFLTLDHIHGGGSRHVREVVGRRGGNLYHWIVKNNFPKNMFQVLCWNCNSGRAVNGGICPHQEKKL